MVWGVVTGMMNWFLQKSLEPVQVELGKLKIGVPADHFVKLPADYRSQRPTSELIELIKNCCQVVKKSERFYSLFDTEWLRTVIRWDRPLRHICAVPWQADLADRLEIYSNVVPRQAYMKRIRSNSQFDGHDQYCTEGFLPMTALDSGDLFLETPAFQSCSSCALLEQFMIETEGTQVGSGTSHVSLQEIVLGAPEINSKKFIKGGIEAEVYTIKLFHGIFAMKKFRDINTSMAKFEGGRDIAKLLFERGRDIALEISHPNIVRCIGHSTAHCALFMEYLELGDLEGFLIERTRYPDGSELPFSFRDSLDVLLQIAKAVEHLHENNFLHGDLKPGNILVSKLPHSDVPSYLVKVADFGCVKPTNGSSAETVKPTDGSSAEIVKPTDGSSAEIVKPTDGSSAEIVEPTDGSSAEIVKPTDGSSAEIVKPTDGSSAEIVEPTDGSSAEIVEPTNGSSATNATNGKNKNHEWVIGSPHYTAPEVLRFRPRIYHPKGVIGPVPDEKIDVYSFAVIAYQVLTGVTHPYANFYRLDQMELDKKIIDGLRPDFDFNSGTLDDERMELLKYIKRCWVEEPKNRPSFLEICKELERLSNIMHQRRGQNEIRQHHSIRRILSRAFQFPSYSIVLLSFIVLLRLVHKRRGNRMC